MMQKNTKTKTKYKWRLEFNIVLSLSASRSSFVPRKCKGKHAVWTGTFRDEGRFAKNITGSTGLHATNGYNLISTKLLK